MAGGALADAALALNVILSRLYWKNGKLPMPGIYDGVRKLTPAERRTFDSLPCDEAQAAQGHRHPARRRPGHGEGCFALRADLAQAGGDGHRPGGQLDQGAVQPGAAASVGDRQLPHRAGPGPEAGVRAAEGGADEGSAVGGQGDGEAAGQAGEVVDDRPERPGVRGGDVGDEGRASRRSRSASAAAARSASSARWRSCSAAPRRCCWASRTRAATPTRPTRACTRATGSS